VSGHGGASQCAFGTRERRLVAPLRAVRDRLARPAEQIPVVTLLIVAFDFYRYALESHFDFSV
jgi:hypothetical protein